MLTVLSPAKKLSKECVVQTQDYQLPQFAEKTEKLVKNLKKMEPKDLMSLMGISENLALLNWERIQNWNKSFTPNNSRESVFSFMGDTYTGLDAKSLDKADIQFSQKHTRILSGLYGILRPLDLIKPYRLEMGTRMKNEKGDNLYEYWNDSLAKFLNHEIRNHEEKTIINCASVEYFKSIDLPILEADIITPQFKEIKNGKLKMISFYAKKARGMMARFIIQNRINNSDGILSFNLDGYSYDSSLSMPFEPVFTRAQA
tara:strand:+ start:373 stop:1146 length:774 start_codon:yes stop_codon:yes gene_type:complete